MVVDTTHTLDYARVESVIFEIIGGKFGDIKIPTDRCYSQQSIKIFLEVKTFVSVDASNFWTIICERLKNEHS